MYRYMNTKSFKILATLFTLTIFTGIASATVSNLQVEGDPVNNTGIIYASGNHDTGDSFSNTIVFNISQSGKTPVEYPLDINASADNSDTAGKFNFTIDFSNIAEQFSDGEVNISADQSDFGFREYESNSSFIMDSNLASPPTISNTESVEGGAINVTFGDENSGDYAEIVSYEVHRSTSQIGGYSWIGNVTDTNATDYEFKDDSSLENGTEYYYMVRPVDSAENRGTFSDPGSTFSDSAGPTFEETSKQPIPSGYTKDISSEITFNLSDANSVRGSSISVTVADSDGTDGDELSSAGTTDNHVEFTDGQVIVDPTASETFQYEPGTVTVDVSVEDTLGNMNTDSWSFTVDTQAPQSIAVDDPNDGEEVISQNTISGSFNEDNEIQSVQVQIKNEEGNYWTGSQFDTSSIWLDSSTLQESQWSYDSSSITSQGTYTVDVNATDKAGNWNRLSSPISYTIDTGAPDLDFTYINDTNVDGESDEIVVNFTEAVSDSNSEFDSAFKLDKGNIDGFSTSGIENDKRIKIFVSGIDTGVRPNLTMLNGTVKDAAGNNLSVNSSIVVEDKARPVLMNARIDSENTSSGNTVVRMDFSENISDPVDELSLGVEGVLSINDNYSDILTADYQLSGSPGVLQTGNSPNITGLGSVEDAAGNPAVLQSNQNITVSTFRKEFVNGWNFFSVPIADTSTLEISDIFTESQLDTIWRYRRGNWSSYTPGNEKGNDFTVLRGGEGYLVKTSSGFTITPNVNNKVATKGIGSFDMDSGWNLVGHFQEFDQPADNTDSGAFDSLGYDFSLAGQSETGEVAAAAVPVEAEVGSAYWVNPFTELNPQSDYVENRESQ